MPGYLDDSWKPVIERLVRWSKNLRISGDGVTFTNGPEGAAANVRQGPGGRSAAPQLPTLLKVTGTAIGGGWYAAAVWLPPASDPSPSSNLTEGALGTQGDDCYYANLREVGATTHDLTNAANTKQKLFYGHRRGTAPDGKAIYVGGDPWMEDCV